MIGRRSLLSASAAVAASAALDPIRSARANAIGARFGAIRWDAWYDNTSGQPGLETQIALGPAQYRFRAPWFMTTNPADPNTVTINGNQQATVDAEIAYAKGAGLKYWAFGWYSTTNPNTVGMMNAFNLYQSSTHKADINWCLWFGYQGFTTEVTAGTARLIGYFQQAAHETVLSGRPLLYLLPDGSAASGVTASVTALRAACVAAGVGNPYIVVMSTGTAAGTAADKTTIGGDALSIYAFAGSTGGGIAQTYASLDTQVQAYWAALGDTGSSVIPGCMMGWDRRPRVEHPLGSEIFGSGQKTMVGYNKYYATATPAELASHLGSCLTWMAANTAKATANSALIYAWNEHDEGGWLCPTWTAGGADHSRLDAISPVIT